MKLEDRRQRAKWIGENRCQARKQLLLLRAFQAYEDEAVHNLRRAKVIAYVLDHYPVVIDPGDLIVGKLSTEPLSADEKAELRAGQTILARQGRGLRFGWGSGSGGVGGHRTVDYEVLLNGGIQGVLDRVTNKAHAIDFSTADDAEKSYFYAASRIVLDAVLRFAGRYQAALIELRDDAGNASDHACLDRLAAIFAHIPAHPPRSFHEALQAVWFLQLCLTFDDISCTGHPDRYLQCFYENDLASGKLTREEALALIEELYLRSNEVFGDWPETIMVGGTGLDGKPVKNGLTTLFLEAIETVGLVNPNVALCYRVDTPDDLLDLCLDKISKGLSHPALYNDRVITAGLVAAGLSEVDARSYQNSTCVEITPVGCSNVQVVAAWLNPIKTLEMMLNGGREMVEDPRPNMRLPDEVHAHYLRAVDEGGLRVELEEPSSFEAFYACYKRVFARTIQDRMAAAVKEEYRRAHAGSCPLVSCFVNDCIERGKDVAAGGARYNYCGVNVAGFSTAVDALSGIREMVYRHGLVSLPELARVLQDNFDGHEALRQFASNRCPKYGNDDHDVDALAVDLYDFIRQEIARYRTALGGAFHIGCFSGWGGRINGRRVASHVSFGAYSAATADGRLKGMPLSECIGPACGADRNGLTALVNSVTKLDHRHGLGGMSVNWRLSKRLLQDAASRQRVRDLIRAFMENGGFELQINVADSETLRDAQQHPEQYRNLVVRIAGYSEYFCNVGEALQDEIIARMTYEDL